MTAADPLLGTTKPPADAKTPALASPDATSGTPGVVNGRPLTWLRIEGLAVAGAALVIFATTGHSWWLIPALVLVPDLSWLAYLAGRQVGAWTYNLTHTAPLPLALLAAGAGWHIGALTVAGAVGLLHLGLDRLMKYGVKYDHSFGMTHLGVHGGH
ncbi:hypothetical protein GCM10023194_67870 [Planotetraspora phitsanulokensis]|uniref:DUF4260 domain-containing protein n=1 Tax=Planotetraspora phitsanulokensis TaxID=575192 RepID=A0A8J3XG00_9ACTN|nr:DUF4260 domain-containing protein [Planotetraspora phitsanulokensis]GII39650.1 hypothetical protein Pph01_46530 [Planotetraspora phitsanulokensis]